MKHHILIKFLGLGALVALLWLFFPFLKSFCVALLMAMAISPLYQKIFMHLNRYAVAQNASTLVATSIVTLLFSLMIFLPLSLILLQLFEHPMSLVDTIRSLGNQLNLKSDLLPSYLQWLEEPFEKLVLLLQFHKEEIISFATKWLGSGLKTFLAMISEMVMIIVFFFFLTLYSKPILLFFLPLVPLGRAMKRQFLKDMSTTMATVFYTLLGVMASQGLAFGLFIAFFDGYNPLLLGFLAAITSVIPLVGTALVWVPIALGEYFSGNTLGALVIAVYSWAMMSFFIDNIVKLIILNFINRKLSGGEVRTHEFIIFFAIIGGLTTFGFWGFLIGPALVAFAITTFKIVRKQTTPLP